MSTVTGGECSSDHIVKGEGLMGLWSGLRRGLSGGHGEQLKAKGVLRWQSYELELGYI